MMKCERCGRNDATMHYRRVVNGYETEAHLCADCARALGYQTDWGSPMQELFSLLPRMAADESFLFSPRLTPSGRRTLRVLPAAVRDAAGAEEPILSDEEQRALRRERERNALQLALSEALDSEDYERAAKLRDQLKALDE